MFPAGRPPVSPDVSVKINGYYNSCAQHHNATIGLHGVGKRIGGIRRRSTSSILAVR